MADLADAGAALVAALAGAIYPAGVSVAGSEGMIYQGWPVPPVLQADLAAGRWHLSVFPGVVEENTTRYPQEWEPSAAGAVAQEYRRVKRDFQVTLWCGTPQQREAVGRLVDPALSVPAFLPLADGSRLRVIYQRTLLEDGNAQVVLYRRDWFYACEYGQFLQQAASAVGQISVNFSGGQA